jgi:hypothetical protein
MQARFHGRRARRQLQRAKAGGYEPSLYSTGQRTAPTPPN